MARRFVATTFTPLRQGHTGTIRQPERQSALEDMVNSGDTLSEDEIAFTKARDGFHQANLSETGWT